MFKHLKRKLGPLALGICGGILVLTAPGCGIKNCSDIQKTFKNHKAELENSRQMLGEEVAKKCDLDNFDIASCELAEHDKGYILKAFGSTSLKDLVGNKYVNVFFDIKEADATNISIAVSKLRNYQIESFDSPEYNIKIGEESLENSFNSSEVGKIQNAAGACQEVYAALNSAVKKAYSTRIEQVATAKSMNKSIFSAYEDIRIKPWQLYDEEYKEITDYIFEKRQGVSTFLKEDIMTTSVSQVFKDHDKNISCFYIDTLQTVSNSKGNYAYLQSCRALVSVEGAELSQEEVYAKFITGDYLCFEEVAREKNGPKVGIVDNKHKEGVEEIELI